MTEGLVVVAVDDEAPALAELAYLAEVAYAAKFA